MASEGPEDPQDSPSTCFSCWHPLSIFFLCLLFWELSLRQALLQGYMYTIFVQWSPAPSRAGRTLLASVTQSQLGLTLPTGFKINSSCCCSAVCSFPSWPPVQQPCLLHPGPPEQHSHLLHPWPPLACTVMFPFTCAHCGMLSVLLTGGSVLHGRKPDVPSVFSLSSDECHLHRCLKILVAVKNQANK